MTIRRFTPDDDPLWDNFVSASRQGTLLHKRAYMDYHSDRFRDCSLIAERNGSPIALLPANLSADGILYSHQGLTYGGWLTPAAHFDGSDMLRIFDSWLEWCRSRDIHSIVYKPVPHIYHRVPAEEDIYALFRFGAGIKTVNLSSAIDLNSNPGMNKLQKRHLKKASSLNPWIRETSDAEEFMKLVETCLKERHDAAPVHSARELNLLKESFPGQIRLFLSGTSVEPEAAVCIYDSNGVAHTQYLATTPSGRENGILTYLLHNLISEVFCSGRYFDLGTSNEDAGRVLNEGLLHQKYGLGARGIAYPIFGISC